jgi:hypothetical protein
LGRSASAWALPITSIAEDRYLKELGLPITERNQIEGLLSGRSSSQAATGLTEEKIMSRAVVRLAANPPPAVGMMQRRTADWLLRLLPLALEPLSSESHAGRIQRRTGVPLPVRQSVPARAEVLGQEYEPAAVLVGRVSPLGVQPRPFWHGAPD